MPPSKPPKNVAKRAVRLERKNARTDKNDEQTKKKSAQIKKTSAKKAERRKKQNAKTRRTRNVSKRTKRSRDPRPRHRFDKWAGVATHHCPPVRFVISPVHLRQAAEARLLWEDQAALLGAS